MLNDNFPLKNLNFLKNVDEIINKLKKYKENTKRGYLISICSALSTDKDTKTKMKIYNQYYKLLSDKNTELKKIENSNVLSETQKKNWITWDDVKNKFLDIQSQVDKFKNNKIINEHNYNILLQYIVLGLYYLKQPRRNEYYKMSIVKKYTDKLPIIENYLDYDNKEFIFNTFKTVKKEGQQIEKIPDELMNVINIYLKFHPIIKNKKLKNSDKVHFLVYHDGTPFNKVNSITRILNKIFNKQIGSSQLRHIYLSSKYSNVLENQKKDAQAMGHSLQQAMDYIKIKK
jgi:integrase